MDQGKESNDEYLEFLCSLGLSGLSEESQRLNAARNNLTDAGQELALNHYPSFIATNECMKNLSSDLLEVQEESEYLVQNIPKFCDLIANFADESRTITKQWREASRMLQKHSTLLEFLEIPQMMETSLRTGNYEEVLRLDTYVKKLRTKYGPGIKFLEDVMKETNKVKNAMAAQLTKELRSAIQLPTCIKVVGHLRQLGKYSDTELRIKFLTVRDMYLQSLVKDIPSSPPLFHLTRTIDLFRINLFDIATQYRAVFSSDDPFQNSSLYSKESNILSSWILTKIEQFFKILESDILACIENEPYFPYDSVIDPCYYFGLSMARIGFDIKPRLTLVFQRMCIRRFRLSLDKAEKTFQDSLKSYSLNETLSKLKVSSDDSSLSLIADISPLKWLMNGILMAFNDIRLVSSLPMGFSVTDVLNKSLIRSSEILLHFCRNQDQTAANVERMQELCTRYISILLPHVKSCLDKLFPPPLLARMMGLSHLEFKKLLGNPNELLIHHFAMEPINSLLQEYVKVQEVIEQEVEYHFMEPEQGVTLQARNEAVMDSSTLESSDGKNEPKDGSGMNERELTSLRIGDDKKRQADDEGEREEERNKEKL